MQAKGRLQCWNADGQELGVPRGMCRQRAGCNPGTAKADTARGLGGSCREGCAGKGQAATLEQQRLTARGLGGSCREEAVQQLEVEAAARELEGFKGFQGFKGFKRLKPGKRQA